MKIYTKTGDAGETGLFGGARVPKDHPRLRAYGTLDEMNAILGMALACEIADSDLKKTLTRIQSEIFQLGAELATPRGKKLSSAPIEEANVEVLEKEIDQMEGQLKPLKNFILPGGSALAATLHLARTVCRRCEREMVQVHRAEPMRGVLLEYVNRLSDYLFVCARTANRISSIEDVPWKPAK